MKLKVYQQGGGLIYSPFIPEQRVVPTTSKSKDDEDDAKLDPLDKELIALMKDENLLPSDIQSISNALITFQRSTQHLSDTAGFGGTGAYRSVMPGMLQIMNMVSTAKFNKNQWDNAVKEMQKHDAGSEVAMDSYGRMFVLNKEGKIAKVNPGEFDNEKYIPLSNSQLLQYRERNAGMDGQLLNAMDDLVGKQDVYKAINEIVKAYGTEENVNLISKDKAVQAVLIDANSPEGIYKLSQKHTAADLQKAFKVLYDELPTNMQHLLKANAALSGEENPEIGAYKFIHSIITNNLDRSVKIDYDPTASKAAGAGGGSDGSTTKVKDTYPEHLMNDPFTPVTYSRIQPGASNLALYAYTQDAGPILQSDGKTRFKSANLSEIMASAAGVGAIVDAQSIAFGDRLVENTQWSQIVYDNSSNMQRVWLPTKPTADGRYVPDLKAVEELNEVNDAIKNKFGDMPNEVAINEWLKERNINAHWDSDKKMVIFDQSVMRPYLAVKAYTDKNAGIIDRNSPYFKDISSEENARAIKDLYNNAAQSGYEDSSKDKYGNKTTHAKRNIYSGVLYMPLAASGVATSIFNTERFPVEDYMGIAGKVQQRYTEQEIQNNMTLNW